MAGCGWRGRTTSTKLSWIRYTTLLSQCQKATITNTREETTIQAAYLCLRTESQNRNWSKQSLSQKCERELSFFRIAVQRASKTSQRTQRKCSTKRAKQNTPSPEEAEKVEYPRRLSCTFFFCAGTWFFLILPTLYKFKNAELKKQLKVTENNKANQHRAHETRGALSESKYSIFDIAKLMFHIFALR